MNYDFNGYNTPFLGITENSGSDHLVKFAVNSDSYSLTFDSLS